MKSPKTGRTGCKCRESCLKCFELFKRNFQCLMRKPQLILIIEMGNGQGEVIETSLLRHLCVSVDEMLYFEWNWNQVVWFVKTLYRHLWTYLKDILGTFYCEVDKALGEVGSGQCNRWKEWRINEIYACALDKIQPLCWGPAGLVFILCAQTIWSVSILIFFESRYCDLPISEIRTNELPTENCWTLQTVKDLSQV